MKLRAKVNTITGCTKHYVGGMTPDGKLVKTKLPDPSWVEIDEEEDEIFLFYYDSEGRMITDIWHETIEDAKKQAKHEFEITEEDWHEIPD